MLGLSINITPYHCDGFHTLVKVIPAFRFLSPIENEHQVAKDNPLWELTDCCNLLGQRKLFWQKDKMLNDTFWKKVQNFSIICSIKCWVSSTDF